MPKKYRFRKMYFVCTDNVLIGKDTWSTTAWQARERAKEKADQQSRTRGMHIVNEIPLEHKVHGFYLVHESLFEELLKEWSKK
jgi:hypothetical protein